MQIFSYKDNAALTTWDSISIYSLWLSKMWNFLRWDIPEHSSRIQNFLIVRIRIICIEIQIRNKSYLILTYPESYLELVIEFYLIQFNLTCVRLICTSHNIIFNIKLSISVTIIQVIVNIYKCNRWNNKIHMYILLLNWFD